MQQFKCHKIVKAAKIVAARTHEKYDFAYLTFEDGTELEVSRSEFAEPHNLAGMEREGRSQREMPCYLVEYEDGYRSISPVKAFEEGYTAFPPKAPDGEIAPIYHICKDGDNWCAIDHTTFGCLADSEAGFGDTPEAALADLLNR